MKKVLSLVLAVQLKFFVIIVFSLISFSLNAQFTGSIVRMNIPTVKEGTYYLQSAIGGKNMDIIWGQNANGTGLHLWDPNAGDAQIFTIEFSNEERYYYIRTKWGRAIDVAGYNTNAGAGLNTYDLHHGDNQKWQFVSAGGGFFKIKSKYGTYIDVQNGNAASGTPIWMYSGNESDAQKWKLIPIATKVMTRFDPKVHGFKFTNNFTVQTQIAGFNGPSFSGLCGGMVYSALDYFYANKTIPQQNYMPAEGMPLQSYIWQRQQQSALPNVDKWAEYGFNPFGSRNREFFNWGIQLGSGRLGELMSKIDRGDPVPLGLQACGNDCGCPGSCPGSHQVLAIGYLMGRYKGDQGANVEDLSIYVYDPNFPTRTLTLKPNVAGAMYLYSEEGGCRWRAYFTDMKYSRSTPPNVPNNPSEIVATFRTGGDDLRGGNDNVHLVLLLRSGATVRFDNVNNGKRWADGSTQTISRPLASNIRAEDIAGVRIETTFSGGWNGDNWNMDGLKIVAKANGVSSTILSQSGAPLMRFTGDARSREFRR